MKRKTRAKIRKPAQEIQDEIFKKFSADKKVELGSQLWRLAKELVANKINYASNRSSPPLSQYR